MLLNALTLLCAALIGFSAHRASLCNVRAVAELMTSGTAHMLWSLIQAVLWMATLTGILVLGFGLVPQPTAARAAVAWALAGGCLFGIGAAVNSGCSLSTLHRLVDGDLSMLATLAGFALSVAAWPALVAAGGPDEYEWVVSPWLRWPMLAPWLLAVLLAWALLRLRRFARWSRRHGAASLRERLLAPAYHLSVGSVVMGLAGGLLYATAGAWSYTNFLRTAITHRVGGAVSPTQWHGLLVACLVAGMLGSALQRGSLTWRWPDVGLTWVRRAAGGALMGAGAVMVPGGNDTLLLSGLSTLTAAALATYAAMLVGIASVIWVMHLVRMPMPEVACTASGCRETDPPPTARSGPGG